MDYRPSVALFALIVGLLSQSSTAGETKYPSSADDDWAYELSIAAKDIYLRKAITVPCNVLGELINKEKYLAASIAIRDAALFGDKGCAQEIQKNSKRLLNKEHTRLAMLFYRSHFGDTEATKALIQSYDKEIGKQADYPAVELFGYMSDWDQTGRRLVQLANRADGSAAECLCSALSWRRFLYGEVSFAESWFRIGKEEKIEAAKLERYYYRCRL
jgi:hypothetical protein